MDVAGLKSRHGNAAFLSGEPRGESVLRLSQLLDTARFPWLMAPSVVKASAGQSSLSHSVSSL